MSNIRSWFMENKTEKIKKILYIALPLMIQGLVFQLQSLTDRAFLGNIDIKYVSAIGSAQMPLVATLDSLVAVSTGLIIIVSRLYGAGDRKGIRRYVKSAMLYNSILGLIIFSAWQLGAESIFTFFQVDPAIVPYSLKYVRISSCYLIFLGADSSLQAMLQGMGKTKPIMYAGILKVVLNIFLSWVFIFGHLGFKPMYVTGAALGMLIANITATALIAIYCFILKRKEYGLHKDNVLWLKIRPYGEILFLGIPTCLEYLLWNLSNLMLIRFINGFSYQQMAIYTLTFGMQCIVYAVFEGSSKASLALIGQNLGAGNRKHANAYFYSCMLLNLAIVSMAGLCFCLFPKQILGIFSKDSDIIQMAIPYLCFTAAIMFPQSMNVICGNAIRANKNTRWMLLSQVFGSCIVIGCSFFLVEVFHLNMGAIYITLFLDEAIRAVVNYLYYIRHYRGERALS